MKPAKKSFLQRGPWAKPALTLTIPESPYLRALLRRRWSLLRDLAKINAQLDATYRSHSTH